MDQTLTDELKAGIAALVPRLRRFGHALCGNRERGDDLVQTACVKALARLEQFQPGTRLDRWMFRIMHTSFLDDLRSQTRRRTDGGDALDALSDGGQDARRTEQRLLLDKVRMAIAELPPDQRTVLVLVAIEGYSYKEAAEMVDVPVGTVMSRLARARARLMPLAGEAAS